MMADHKQKSDWDRTAAVLAMIHNTNVTKRTQAKPPARFNPFRKPKIRKLSPKESVAALASALIR